MTDKQYLISKGWTVARVEREGFIKRILWTDPKRPDVTPSYTQLALYVQANRDKEEFSAR